MSADAQRGADHHWNAQAGARWVALSDQLGLLGRMVMDRAGIELGKGSSTSAAGAATPRSSWAGSDAQFYSPLLVPYEAGARHVTLPPAPEPSAPGPFAFAELEYVRGCGLVSRAIEQATLRELGPSPRRFVTPFPPMQETKTLRLASPSWLFRARSPNPLKRSMTADNTRGAHPTFDATIRQS